MADHTIDGFRVNFRGLFTQEHGANGEDLYEHNAQLSGVKMVFDDVLKALKTFLHVGFAGALAVAA